MGMARANAAFEITTRIKGIAIAVVIMLLSWPFLLEMDSSTVPGRTSRFQCDIKSRARDNCHRNETTGLWNHKGNGIWLVFISCERKLRDYDIFCRFR